MGYENKVNPRATGSNALKIQEGVLDASLAGVLGDRAGIAKHMRLIYSIDGMTGQLSLAGDVDRDYEVPEGVNQTARLSILQNGVEIVSGGLASITLGLPGLIAEGQLDPSLPLTLAYRVSYDNGVADYITYDLAPGTYPAFIPETTYAYPKVNTPD